MGNSPRSRGRGRSSSPVLGPAGQRGETNFCFFFSPKRRPQPSPPRRAKVSAFQRQGPSPAGLLKVVTLRGAAQGCYLGGARAEARGLAYFAREAKYQNSWGSMAAGPNWQGCRRALDLANWVSDQVRNGYRPSSRADSKDLLGGRSFSRSSVGHWLPPSGDLL